MFKIQTLNKPFVKLSHQPPNTFFRRGITTELHTPSKTHFGFKTVDEDKKQSMVAGVFHNVANKYDLMNDLMSAGIHRVWKNEFMTVLNPTPGTTLLDVAGGTGDIAFRFLEHIK